MGIVNSKGFSLIEVLVAVGIMAIVALGMSSIAEFNFKAARSVTQSYDFASFQSLVMMATADPSTTGCALALRNSGVPVKINPLEPPYVVGASGISQIFIPGQASAFIDVNNNTNFNTYGVGLSPFILKKPTQYSLSPNTWIFPFILSANKLNAGGTGGVVGGAYVTNTFQIMMTLSGPGPSYSIQSCSSATATTNATTVKAWATFDNTGKVINTYNISGVTPIPNTAIYQVNFAQPLPNSSYSISVVNTPDVSGGTYFSEAPVGGQLSGCNALNGTGPTTYGFNLAVVDSTTGCANVFQGKTGATVTVTVSQ